MVRKYKPKRKPLDKSKMKAAVLAGLDYCKEHGIVVVTLPPHCSHKLQPLDRSVFGPLKKAINTQYDNWVTSNPNVPMTIYHIPGIIKTSMPIAATNKNIVSGFECTGIFPLNENVFQDHEFMPSLVTYRPFTPTIDHAISNESCEGFLNESFATVAAFEEVAGEPQGQSTPIQSENEEASNMSVISTSSVSNLSSEFLNATLESVRPFPKAKPRTAYTRGRKKRHSAVLTRSPVMKQLREEQEERSKKKEQKEAKAKVPKKKPAPKSAAKPAKIAPRATRTSLPANIMLRTTRSSIAITSSNGQSTSKASSTSTATTNEPSASKASTSKASTSARKEESSDEDDWSNTCCICSDPLLRSDRYKVCIECRHKAHVNCVRTSDPIFTCMNCLTDESDYSDSS